MLTHIPISKIEDVFMTTISDLHSIVVLDSIKEIPPESSTASATVDGNVPTDAPEGSLEAVRVGAPADGTADEDLNTYADGCECTCW